MLLGSTNKKDVLPVEESFIMQLMLQERYAQVYELLHQQPITPSSLYNLALCLHWSGNYNNALSRLDSIQLSSHVTNDNKLNANSEFTSITKKQNENADYLHGMTEAYIKRFPALAGDAIVRLKTDCWLKLGNFAKVVAVATPVAHKGYKNIKDALQLANTANDKRI
jgi:predicted glycosyltransferase involved in capsule biosynthesis